MYWPAWVTTMPDDGIVRAAWSELYWYGPVGSHSPFGVATLTNDPAGPEVGLSTGLAAGASVVVVVEPPVDASGVHDAVPSRAAVATAMAAARRASGDESFMGSLQRNE